MEKTLQAASCGIRVSMMSITKKGGVVDNQEAQAELGAEGAE